jgi:hypothetical protein
MSVENRRLAAVEAPVFIPGDHSTFGCMPKFGQVRECNPNPCRGKIIIDWEDGSYSSVPVVNVMKIDDGETLGGVGLGLGRGNRAFAYFGMTLSQIHPTPYSKHS